MWLTEKPKLNKSEGNTELLRMEKTLWRVHREVTEKKTYEHCERKRLKETL